MKNSIMIGDHTIGFDLMHHVAIDQHHLKRNRIFDMIDVIRSHPDLLGIGIDESTAIVVQQDLFEVLGGIKKFIFRYMLNTYLWRKYLLNQS